MTVLRCDVLVAGGGPAGLAAAVAAARAGARVLLLERRSVLGGLATSGLVGTVCGLYRREEDGVPPRFVVDGFPREFAERLAHTSGTSPLPVGNGLWVLPYRTRAFERLADDLLQATGRVELALHANLVGVEAAGDRIVRAQALAWGDSLTIEPTSVVDATGEATAIALAGGLTEEGLDEQAPSLVFRLEDTDPAALGKGPVPVLLALARGVRDGVLPPGCERLTPVPGAASHGTSAWKLGLSPSLPMTPGNAWRQVTKWEREGRERIDAIVSFLTERVAGFGGARLGAVAAEVGVRSGRRVRGQATLTRDDVLGGVSYPDGIARGVWPAERWTESSRPHLEWPPKGAAYEVRLGCLRPRGLANVFVAGRCLSAEPIAHASVRVIGTALGTGWAAGVAAARLAGGGAAEDVVPEIRGTWETGRETG